MKPININPHEQWWFQSGLAITANPPISFMLDFFLSRKFVFPYLKVSWHNASFYHYLNVKHYYWFYGLKLLFFKTVILECPWKSELYANMYTHNYLWTWTDNDKNLAFYSENFALYPEFFITRTLPTLNWL